MSFVDNFGKIAVQLSRNPLGIIGLAFVLVYGIAGYVSTSDVFSAEERKIIVYFLVLFPVLIIGVFYKLVTSHHTKLYAPSDFSDEANFVSVLESKIEQSPKLNQIENLTKEIKKEVYDQPLYRYLRLTEEGKIMVLVVFKDYELYFDKYAEERKFNLKTVSQQAMEVEKYGWITLEPNVAKLTDLGKEEISTFEDICYGRMR
jgi:hypothetical protein